VSTDDLCLTENRGHGRKALLRVENLHHAATVHDFRSAVTAASATWSTSDVGFMSDGLPSVQEGKASESVFRDSIGGDRESGTWGSESASIVRVQDEATALHEFDKVDSHQPHSAAKRHSRFGSLVIMHPEQQHHGRVSISSADLSPLRSASRRSEQHPPNREAGGQMPARQRSPPGAVDPLASGNASRGQCWNQRNSDGSNATILDHDLDLHRGLDLDRGSMRMSATSSLSSGPLHGPQSLTSPPPRNVG
jgi:hypothetical protein